jgi:8-oxo-dGTP pyrophosphatase MutT (NUDIX family)
MPLTAALLLDSLSAYAPATPDELRSRDRIRDFLTLSPDNFLRPNPAGHITASAVIARGPAPEFLLLWHRKLDRWLQPGGHLEPSDESAFAAALREAREETGIGTFSFPIADRILDVDVHPIPAHGPDPPHFHYDIRHLLTAETPPPTLPEQTRWFTLEDALSAGVDSSLERALRKASVLLGNFAFVPTTYHLPPTT